LLAEVIYDIALGKGASTAEALTSPDPAGPFLKKEAAVPSAGPRLARPAMPADEDAHEAPTLARPAVMPFKSSTAFFADRFASAFPGVRSTTWFADPDEIATRLLKLLELPLWFSDGTPIWWWRGSNFHIERFEKLTHEQFIMNADELKIARIAAVPGKSYKRHFVYVQTEAMAPTGLYPEHYERIAETVAELCCDYEECGCLSDGCPLTRAQHDDGSAMIDNELIDVCGKSELRIRYITSYNFLIAAQGSPINNSDFDQELEYMLNAALKGDTEQQVDKICARVDTLPLLKRFDD
jgi:hypothetical protein